MLVTQGKERITPRQLGQSRKSRCLQSFAQLRAPKNFYKRVYDKKKKTQTCLHVSKDNLLCLEAYKSIKPFFKYRKAAVAK